MNALFIEGEMNSPLVNFNPSSGLLEIIGRSIPENPVKFYQPVEDWLSDLIETNPKEVTLFVHLDYLNTHSTECLLILLKRLEAYYKSLNNEVKVSWNFDEDDEDMGALGEDLASIVTIPFTYHEVAEED